MSILAELFLAQNAEFFFLAIIQKIEAQPDSNFEHRAERKKRERFLTSQKAFSAEGNSTDQARI